MITRIFVSIMLSWLLIYSGNAQDKFPPELKSNFIYAELDYLVFPVIIDYTINYERTLHSGKDYTRLTNLRFGFGGYTMGHLGGGEKGRGFKLSINPLFGNGKSFFESDLGLGFANITDCQMNTGCPDWRFWPIVNIGYRYQSEMIFRIYLGSLGLGIGLGVNF